MMNGETTMKIVELFRHGLRAALVAFLLFPLAVIGLPVMLFVDWVGYDEEDELDKEMGMFWYTQDVFRSIIKTFGKSWKKMSEVLDNS